MRNIGKLFNESFRNFKLVKLFGQEQKILSRFQEENKNLIRASIMRNVLLETPRLFLETIGFTILVSAVMYIVYKVATPEYVIPILSMYALAFYRFMPSTTRIMEAYSQISFNKGTIELSEEIMVQEEKLGNKLSTFEKLLEIKNLSFGYQENKPVLTNVFLNIKKHERIALVGESGAGKSTLADVIMGFYLIKNGAIFADGQKLTKENIKSWRKKIGYIPQQIYLFDGTVAGNVVMGRDFCEEQVIKVLKKANIYDFLLEKNGLKTKVGESGILLSGGQMQRIAIARALYSDPEILVLDEATSALDDKTESKIMNEIYSAHKDKTLIIIAHRISTVLRCEKIYEIKDCKIEPVAHESLIKKLNKKSEHSQKNLF
jgi:ABC-type multidrug transport system fused ATPase/permease subunit